MSAAPLQVDRHLGQTRLGQTWTDIPQL